MSLNIVGTALSAAQIALLQFAAPGAAKRSIGTLVAMITVSEKHEDDVEITEHPVEIGTQIADHAYLLPSSVTIQCGWSASPASTLVGDLFNKVTGAPANTLSSPREVYQKLLDMRAKFELLTVLTGKRTYKNMLIKSLQVVTDRDSENTLIVTAVLREIVMVSTQTAILPASTQAQPASTAATLNTGRQSLTTPNNFKSSVWPPAQ